ncbi:OLC1v1011720C1 [Oldenlandia corymbosa var. corymbosa]|uniref:OLC1v1011720C1 n=1 Tax=Oldenlandia corymbosa var. corymbosa TaxID=529605 RepID=A0AAV1DUE7_OLDCO|nr:OLC1v1011720C1 [Oldenlandia corymbosa var. corymbosa]
MTKKISFLLPTTNTTTTTPTAATDMEEKLHQNPSKSPRIKSHKLALDCDHKATEFRPFTLSSPHMRAFHLAWLSLFACYFSTFSIPPLLPIIREDLNLSPSDIGTAGIAAFIGSILSRLTMGPACDLFGPRLASTILSLLTAPVILSMSLVSTPQGFIVVRFLIGFSLANFVANQFWMSSMFSGCVVGLANGVAAGWANVGAGVTQIVMPMIYSRFLSAGMTSSTAWRMTFVLPAIFQVITAIMVLVFGQDSPDGSFRRRGIANTEKKPDQIGCFSILFNGLRDYRGWMLGMVYGFSFGVELTTDNIVAQYFYDRFHLDVQTAGAIAASFGLANLVSRPAGGVVSDLMGKKFGMRGRLWSLWAAQTVAGILCVVLGLVNSLWASILVMCCFSLFVQASSGLTFGVVPFVSKRYLGVISGLTGSGGTLGAVITQLLLFSGSTELSTQTSISLMGFMMLASTLPITLIYFPRWGGMFCGPSSKLDSEDDDEYHLLQ